MNNIKPNEELLIKKWQSLRLCHIVIHTVFLFFYAIGTLQSFSIFTSPSVFNTPLMIPLGAIFLSAYIVHCLINKKDQQCFYLIPVLTFFTTPFITINSHFEIATSQNCFLYFTLLLPLFYAFILSYNFQLLIVNNLIIIISYSFTAVVGETSTLVVIYNIVFLLTLCYLTTYLHVKNNSDKSTSNAEKEEREPALTPQNAIYLKSIIHDIRQPLSSLSLYSHLLKDKSSDPQQKMIIKSIVGAATQLEHWLSSLLELARLNSNSVQVNIKNVPLETCLSPVIEKYNNQAAAQGMMLKTHITKAALYTDSKLLSEIIESLLSNALLHGSQEKGGAILLTARHQQGNVNIQIWNRGKRIHDEHLNSIFDELYYSENPTHNKAKGIGLGLALSQQKALLLNTEIKVKTSNTGSCFSISITKGVHTGAPVAPPSKILQQENNQRILLVDDDESILSALSMLLQTWGYTVDCAENSEKAMQLLKRNEFSMIISDYRLPGNKTGIDLIKLAQQKQAIPSVLLTGDVEPEKLKEGEFKDYKILNKPIRPAVLRLLMRQLLAV